MPSASHKVLFITITHSEEKKSKIREERERECEREQQLFAVVGKLFLPPRKPISISTPIDVLRTSTLEYITWDNLIFFIDAHGFSVLALILSKEEKKREKKHAWKSIRIKKKKLLKKSASNKWMANDSNKWAISKRFFFTVFPPARCENARKLGKREGQSDSHAPCYQIKLSYV